MKQPGNLIEVEELARGSVASSVYYEYLKSMKGWAFAFLGFSVIMETLRIGNTFVLSNWAEAGVNVTDVSTSYYSYYMCCNLSRSGGSRQI